MFVTVGIREPKPGMEDVDDGSERESGEVHSS